jgi:hypothetical protein
LHESLTHLDLLIKTKVGKAFLKRNKQQTESEQSTEPAQEEKKVRLTRKARNTARQLFDSESSISLDLSEFNSRDQARRIEYMLKDYVQAQEAMIELAAKLTSMNNDHIFMDGNLGNQSPAFG